MATTRAKKAFTKMAENGGIISKAMRDAGYSEVTSKTPSKLTKSKGWAELMKKYLPDDALGKTHQGLLEAKSVEKAPFHYKMKDDEIKNIVDGQGFKFIGTKRFMTNAIVYFSIPDNIARKNALDMAYKLGGKYAPERSLVGHLTINNEQKQKADKIIQAILDGDAE